MEGSFGTEKQHYSLDKIKARTKMNEILWIFFSVHTANTFRIAKRLAQEIPDELAAKQPNDCSDKAWMEIS
jgi:hypothetical protein